MEVESRNASIARRSVGLILSAQFSRHLNRKSTTTTVNLIEGDIRQKFNLDMLQSKKGEKKEKMVPVMFLQPITVLRNVKTSGMIL